MHTPIPSWVNSGGPDDVLGTSGVAQLRNWHGSWSQERARSALPRTETPDNQYASAASALLAKNDVHNALDILRTALRPEGASVKVAIIG